jgi:hypothetical protein
MYLRHPAVLCSYMYLVSKSVPLSLKKPFCILVITIQEHFFSSSGYEPCITYHQAETICDSVTDEASLHVIFRGTGAL